MFKKSIIIILSCLMIFAFTGFTKETIQTASYRIQFNDTSTDSKLSPNNLTFNKPTIKFFEGDINKSLNKLEPLLVSGSLSALDKKELILFNENSSDKDIEWDIAYHLLNDYKFRVSNLEINKDGILVVPEHVIEFLFVSSYYEFNGVIPSVSGKHDTSIKFDKTANEYLISRSDSPNIEFILKDITLSKANSATNSSMSATIALSVKYPNKEKTNEIIFIEVIPNPSSEFGYNIMSIDYENK